MAVNTILNKSLTTFNQTDYLLKCDLLNKYLIKNIYDIPQYTSISIKYKNSFLFLENNINKFQVILFFYFILSLSATVWSKSTLISGPGLRPGAKSGIHSRKTSVSGIYENQH